MDGFGCSFSFCFFFFVSFASGFLSPGLYPLCGEPEIGTGIGIVVGTIMETVMVGDGTRLGYRETAGGCAQAPTDTE